jgi:hypothetical protein
VRKAQVRGRSASWDGVERAVELSAHGLAAASLADVPFEGVAPAASLHVAVFNAQGAKLQESQAGIELLVRVRPGPDDDQGRPTLELTPRDDLFADRSLLQDALGAAFAPLLPRLP